MPSITAGCAFGLALGFAAGFSATFFGDLTFGAAVLAACFFTGWSGLITGTAALEELPPPSSMNPPARASRAAKPAAARIRTRGLRLTVFLSAFGAARLTVKCEGRGLPRPSRRAVKPGLAAARFDVGSGAGLVVLDRPGDRVRDVLRGRVGH